MMKKRIAIVAITALASQLHAGDLGNMVSRVAADLITPTGKYINF